MENTKRKKQAKPILDLLKNIRRFDEKEKGTDFYAGWDCCLDTILQDIMEWIDNKR